MINKTVYKNIVLYTVLLATLSATAYFKSQDSLMNGISEPVTNVKERKKVDRDIEKSTRKSIGVKNDDFAKVDIFEVYKPPVQEVVVEKVKPIHIPPPPVVVFTPPPVETTVPMAPPVALKYIGKILGDNEYQVFVEFKGNYLAVKEGEIIQKTYKIEKIKPPTMTVTYIPMSILQDMQIGELN
jgi:hypothetical protein